MKTGVRNAEGGGQKGIMEEKTLPVVPSSWEEGCGVVEKNNVRTYYTPNNYNKSNLICRYHPYPSFQKEGTTN